MTPTITAMVASVLAVAELWPLRIPLPIMPLQLFPLIPLRQSCTTTRLDWSTALFPLLDVLFPLQDALLPLTCPTYPAPLTCPTYLPHLSAPFTLPHLPCPTYPAPLTLPHLPCPTYPAPFTCSTYPAPLTCSTYPTPLTLPHLPCPTYLLHLPCPTYPAPLTLPHLPCPRMTVFRLALLKDIEGQDILRGKHFAISMNLLWMKNVLLMTIQRRFESFTDTPLTLYWHSTKTLLTLLILIMIFRFAL